MLLFDRRCPGCGRPDTAVCRPCVDRCELASPRWLQPPAGVASAHPASLVVPLFHYDNVAARLVLAGKNGGRRDLLRWAAVHLARRVREVAPPVELVTWVPAQPVHRRHRRFDQAQVVAATVARELAVPARRCLVRADRTSRRGLDRSARLIGPDVTTRRRLGGTVLLVDDVMATGATLSRCVDALRSAGASEVVAAVVAVSDTAAPRPSPSADVTVR